MSVVHRHRIVHAVVEGGRVYICDPVSFIVLSEAAWRELAADVAAQLAVAA